MDGCASRNVIRFQCLVIRQLFAAVNQLDLIDLNAFLLLQRLLDGQHILIGFEVQSLLTACQCFDKDLKRKEQSDCVRLME